MKVRSRPKLKTVVKYNYTMMANGKLTTFPKVILTVSSFDGKLCISVAELERLGIIKSPIRGQKS